MKRSVDDMLKELYELDKDNNYKFNFYGGTQWEIKNQKTHEGLYTDGGFTSIKNWMMEDIEKHQNVPPMHKKIDTRI